VRVNTSALPLFGATRQPLPLLPKLRKIRAAGTVREWPAGCRSKIGVLRDACVLLRKSEQAIALAQRRHYSPRQKKQQQTRPETGNTPAT